MSRSKIIAVGAVAFVVLCSVCLFVMVPRIENDIVSRANHRLDIASLPQNLVSVSGRDLILEGVVDSEARYESVVHALAEVDGIRSIENRIEVAQKAAVRIKPRAETMQARVVVRFNQNSTVLHGVVPTEERRVSIIDMARRFSTNVQVHDQLEVVEGIPDVKHVESLALIARVLSTVDQGVLRAESSAITIEGIVADDDARLAVGRLVRAAAPRAEVVNGLRVISAPADPGGEYDRIEGYSSQAGHGLASNIQSQIDEVLLESGVDFVENTVSLTAPSQRSLNRIAGILLQAPKVQIEIAGHTEELGDRETEMQLSRKRARAVVDYLTGRGIASSRLRAAGYGSQIPRAEPLRPGRGDRRIEFHVIGED